jgi:hypothetical protein
VSFLRRPSENTCPGIEEFIRPTIKYKVCEKCGGRVEVWSDEGTGVCLDCGERWTKKEPKPSCLDYCEYAAKCRGIIMKRRRAAGG